MKQHLSLSQTRRLIECSAREMAVQNGEWPSPEPSDAMLVGSYLDAILTTGTGAEWLADHPEILAKSGKSKGEPKAAFAAVPFMARKFIDSPAAGLVAGVPAQVKIESDFLGTPVVGVLDWLDLENGRIFDLKTRADFSDNWHVVNGRNVKMPWWYDYAEQFALYQSIVEEKHGVTCDCFPLAMAKTTGFPIRAVRYEQDVLDLAYARLCERWALCGDLKANPIYCRSCDYCAEHAPFEIESAAMWVVE